MTPHHRVIFSEMRLRYNLLNLFYRIYESYTVILVDVIMSSSLVIQNLSLFACRLVNYLFVHHMKFKQQVGIVFTLMVIVYSCVYFFQLLIYTCYYAHRDCVHLVQEIVVEGKVLLYVFVCLCCINSYVLLYDKIETTNHMEINMQFNFPCEHFPRNRFIFDKFSLLSLVYVCIIVWVYVCYIYINFLISFFVVYQGLASRSNNQFCIYLYIYSTMIIVIQ